MRNRRPSLYHPLLVAPGFLVYSVFFLLPVVVGFYYAFTDWNMYLDRISFNGFTNFRRMFVDPISAGSLSHTLIFAVCTTIGKNVFGLALALALNQAVRTRNTLRAVFFSPAVLSLIVVGLLFSSILYPDGILNVFLRTVGLGALARSWLADRTIVMYTISFVEIWQWSGFHMAIYLAGLQAIPKEFIEASVIDGVNGWQKFARITMPLIISTFNINLVISLIGGFKVFDLVFILTNGGPGRASEVINTQIYRVFGNGEWGFGTAMNLVLFLVITLIALTVLNLLRRREVEL
ncbi:MAG TPA: sugar ABC transporter permease [Spirochaetia bacterium]|nr:sugar ABC transporter permease [Spirochaetia bacterium]